MENYPLVVLANEPETYRSLLAAELPFLRPNLRVLEVDPAGLAAAVAAYQPAVVISSRPVEVPHGPPCAVLILRAEEIESFIQSSDETISNPRLSDILHAIDRALAPEPLTGQESPHGSPEHPAATAPQAPAAG